MTIPLVKQVDNFAATRAAMEQKLGRRELNKLIPKSIFLLSFGTKDLFHVWYLQNLRAMDKETSVAYLLSSYGAGIEALFHAGVQKCWRSSTSPRSAARRRVRCRGVAVDMTVVTSAGGATKARTSSPRSSTTGSAASWPTSAITSMASATRLLTSTASRMQPSQTHRLRMSVTKVLHACTWKFNCSTYK